MCGLIHLLTRLCYSAVLKGGYVCTGCTPPHPGLCFPWHPNASQLPMNGQGGLMSCCCHRHHLPVGSSLPPKGLQSFPGKHTGWWRAEHHLVMLKGPSTQQTFGNSAILQQVCQNHMGANSKGPVFSAIVKLVRSS